MAKPTPTEIEILAALDRAAPKITKIAVNSSDPLLNFYMLDLKRVCYITTRNAMDEGKPEDSKADKETSGEIVFVCEDGEEYSNYSSLKEIETKLEVEKGNVWFMRTSNSHIINLSKVKGTKVNNSRDIFFKGLEKPVINGVTRTYLEKFKECPFYLR